jgi:hypothetical protein
MRQLTLKYPQLWVGCVGAWCPSIQRPGTSTLIDQSNSKLNATLTNMESADWTLTDGLGKRSLSFDGSDEYARVATGILTFSGVCAWIRCSTPIATQIFVESYNSTAIPTNEKGFFIGIDSSGFAHCDGRDDTSYKSCTSTTVIGDSKWHHVCGRMKNSYLEIWVDGKLENRTLLLHDVKPRPKLNVGGLYSTGDLAPNGNFYNGLIDDIRIYSQLSSSQIVLLSKSRGVAYEQVSRRLVPKQPARPFSSTKVLRHRTQVLANPSLWQGCVGAWAPCLGPTGFKVTDYSPYKKNATMSGSISYQISNGQYYLKSAASTARATVPNDDLYNPLTENFSVSMWFIMSDVTTDQKLITKGHHFTSVVGWRFYVQSGYIWTSARADASNYTGILGSAISTNTLYHVGMCIDRTNNLFMFFLDGRQITSGSITSFPSITNTYDLSIGSCNTSSNTSPVNGGVFDVRIYKGIPDFKKLSLKPTIAYDMKYTSRYSTSAISTPLYTELSTIATPAPIQQAEPVISLPYSVTKSLIIKGSK